MNLRTFIYTYFKSWDIAGWTTCGIDYGTMKLISGETCIKVCFNLNGERHWSGNNVTVDHIVAC